MQEQESKEAESAAIENLEKGVAFLEENGKKEGITTTESGLQYEVVSEGDRHQTIETSTVTVYYEGSLIDGTIFESSYETRMKLVYISL